MFDVVAKKLLQINVSHYRKFWCSFQCTKSAATATITALTATTKNSFDVLKLNQRLLKWVRLYWNVYKILEHIDFADRLPYMCNTHRTKSTDEWNIFEKKLNRNEWFFSTSHSLSELILLFRWKPPNSELRQNVSFILFI